MNSYDTGHLIYLILLGLMVLGAYLAHNRLSVNRMLQQATVWALIFFGVVAAIGLWDDISRTAIPRQVNVAGENRIIVPRSPDGHYYLMAQVNGAPLRFVVDTGASDMVLTRRDAQAAGLAPETLNFMGRAMTANGEVRTAPVRLDNITLGSVTDSNVPATVNGGEMTNSLLGMSYLQRWGRIEITQGELILTR
ncbi:retropepsin-like aspartic protease family protein [Sulfitobacter sabulilitoris]|uniref:TIGR02281 family clan AA aspartic protease n=1 Tax=Sulfitobacter sabulilitoris TaxID=2562655 RepID=A0A5S3PMI2_9RHOB|nr:TIGR02281 family clan AA aspartic protease [Sulfitobacter sabulilitoris]TMM54790.1 TIGR02281 family clan AA aspartic protease [Sulfitobacter sabulilitoris]